MCSLLTAPWRTLGVLAVAATLGCGSTSPESRLGELNKTNLQRVTNLYLAYQMAHEFQGPKDEKGFQEFIRDVQPEKLQRIGIDPASIDSLFFSERDGQSFNIRYGVRGSMMGCREPVVFEAEGESGKRMVGFLDMTQREVEGVEYDQLWSGDSKELASNQRT